MEQIEVFAEITCPFTHVGIHRLLNERARLGVATPWIRVRAWPLELVNGAPLDGAGVAEKGQALRAQVAPGLFARVDPAAFPSSSLPALALVEAAYRVSIDVGEAVSVAVRDALFEFGQDISDPGVLAAIASDHGVGEVTQRDHTAVTDSWAEGQRRGVVGSPHFFAGDQDVFCPILEISRPDGQLHVEIDQAALDDFIGRVFGTGD